MEVSLHARQQTALDDSLTAPLVFYIGSALTMGAFIMARANRLILPNRTHHILHRGYNRGSLFFSEEDSETFLDFLGDALESQQCSLHAYVLMVNHYHLVITSGDAESIPRLMQSIGRRYTAYLNQKYDREGMLWDGRYKSTILDSDGYVLGCQCYVEANPLRAGIVFQPDKYRWSSYSHNAKGRVDPLLSAHPTYHALGATAIARRQAYRELFSRGLTKLQLETLRDATQREWVPGGDRFREEIKRALGRRIDPPILGRPRKA